MEDGQRWIAKQKNAMVKACRPEVNTSALLGEQLLSCFMQMIGILHWGVELGRMDIMTDLHAICPRLLAARRTSGTITPNI